MPSVASASSTPALAEMYNTRVRPCIEIIDGLRAHGLGQELHLPSIAVIGDQSVGKSSVLESISGIQLPRGTGIVTRCPLQLQMRTSLDDSWGARIRYKKIDGTSVDCEITEPKQVEAEIRTAQELMTKDEKDISEAPIELTVESPESPDLTLIDLPGIARFSKQSAGEQVSHVTRNLIMKYIEREEVIILVVVPCHTDIETIEALALAQAVDPDHSRTMGVMTFPDLVNRGAERDVMDIVNNRTIPLKKGYVMVKCRTQEDIVNDKPLVESIRDEQIFFENHPHYRSLSCDQVGTRTLGLKLSTELFDRIREYVPLMLKEVEEKITWLQQELDEMGPGALEDPDERRRQLIGLLTKFTDNFSRVATGDHRHHEREDRLFSRCRQEWEQLADDISSKVNITKSGDSVEARKFWEYVHEEVVEQRGSELPLFLTSYPVCERVVRNYFLKVVHEPSVAFIGRVNHQVEEVLRNMAHEVLKEFPKLESYIKVVTEDIRKNHLNQCKDDVEKIFMQEEVVWTQDRTYLSEVEICKRDSTAKPAPLPDDSSKKAASSDSASTNSIAASELPGIYDKATEQVLLGVRSYMQVAVRRMCDTIPMSVMHYLLMRLSTEVKTHILALAATPDTLDPLFEEDIRVQEKRHSLKEKIDKLQFAQRELAKL